MYYNLPKIIWGGEKPPRAPNPLRSAYGFITQMFIRRNIPHRLLMDNDPKHCSASFVNFMRENGINIFPTPPQSPDITSGIECVWHELKRYLHKVYRPRNEAELIRGVVHFWENRLTIDKCQKYIDHKFQTIPSIILHCGKATGYWSAFIQVHVHINVMSEQDFFFTLSVYLYLVISRSECFL